MEIISINQFNEICDQSGSKIIKFGRNNLPKVIEQDQDIMIKFFYPKNRWFTSTTLKPQAMRFKNNAEKLRRYGYHAPEIVKVLYCKSLNTYLVFYKKIRGQDIRRLAKGGKIDLLKDVACFVSELHAKGIIFRAIHLENLMLQQNESFALIDISDVKFKNKSLNMYHRYRNLSHLFASVDDQSIWHAFGIDVFLKHYYKAAGISKVAQHFISRFVERP